MIKFPVDAPKRRVIKTLTLVGFQMIKEMDDHAERIIRLIKKYRNLPMDLADASLVILAEELGHGRILSTDVRDFSVYRWKEKQPFENLFKH